jgi:hypothetical protein
MLTSARDAGELASFACQTSGRKPWYSLNNRLGGPQGQCGHCEQEKILLPMPEISTSHWTSSQ